MADDYVHRVMVKDGVEEARSLIEQNLHVETFVADQGPYGTAIDWYGPRDMNVDFLRPKFLPQR